MSELNTEMCPICGAIYLGYKCFNCSNPSLQGQDIVEDENDVPNVIKQMFGGKDVSYDR